MLKVWVVVVARTFRGGNQQRHNAFVVCDDENFDDGSEATLWEGERERERGGETNNTHQGISSKWKEEQSVNARRLCVVVVVVVVDFLPPSASKHALTQQTAALCVWLCVDQWRNKPPWFSPLRSFFFCKKKFFLLSPICAIWGTKIVSEHSQGKQIFFLFCCVLFGKSPLDHCVLIVWFANLILDFLSWKKRKKSKPMWLVLSCLFGIMIWIWPRE